MPTTTNNGWPTPADTDLVKNGADAIRDLGQAIDTTLGVYSPSTPGLVKINTTSFSGVSSVSAPASTFTSTYKNYRILANITSATNTDVIYLRVRAAGTDLTTSTYKWSLVNNSYTTSTTGDGSSSSTVIQIGYIPSTNGRLSCDIYNPQTANNTFVTSAWATSSQSWTGGGMVNNTTSYDSFSIIAAAGTFVGSVSVYGYNE